MSAACVEALRKAKAAGGPHAVVAALEAVMDLATGSKAEFLDHVFPEAVAVLEAGSPAHLLRVWFHVMWRAMDTLPDEGGTTDVCGRLAQALLDAGVLPTVVEALQTHIADADVQTHGMQLLRKLSYVLDDAAPLLAAGGGLDVALQSLAVHSGDASLQIAALYAVNNLCYEQRACTAAIVDGGGLRLLVGAMWAFQGDLDVLEATLSVVTNMCSAVEDMASQGVVDCALAALRTHPFDANVQQCAAGALQSLTVADAGEEAVVAAGGVDSLYDTLAHFPDNPDVLKPVVGVLRNLAAKDAHKRIIIMSGGVSRVVAAAMTHLSTVPELVTSCLDFCSNLGKENQAAGTVLEACLPMVLAAMDAHPDDAELAMSALLVLEYCIVSDPGCEPVATACGAHTAAFAVLRAHPANARVCEAVLVCLRCFTKGCATHVATEDGLHRVYTATSTHVGSLDVASAAALFLWSLCVRDVVHPVLKGTNAHVHLLAILDAHPGNGDVLECVFGALSGMCGIDGLPPVLVAVGAMDRAVSALQTTAERGVVQQACFMLRGLASDPVAVHAVLAVGSLALVYHTLDVHVEADGVVDSCVRFLWCLCFEPRGQAALRLSGAVPRLLTVLEAHAGGDGHLLDVVQEVLEEVETL